MNTISPVSFGNRGLKPVGTHSSEKFLEKTLEELAQGTKYAEGKFIGNAPKCEKMVQPRFSISDGLGKAFKQENIETLDPNSVYHPTLDFII